MKKPVILTVPGTLPRFGYFTGVDEASGLHCIELTHAHNGKRWKQMDDKELCTYLAHRKHYKPYDCPMCKGIEESH